MRGEFDYRTTNNSFQEFVQKFENDSFRRIDDNNQKKVDEHGVCVCVRAFHLLFVASNVANDSV